MFLNAFLVVAVVTFLFLFAIWNNKDFLNIFLKMVFGLLAVWSLVCALLQFGFHK